MEIIAETTVSQLRTISSHFQRSINVTYDEGNDAYIGGYIPTEAGVRAISNILSQSEKTIAQRSHVLHAPYGSGKSLLSLALGAFANGEKTEGVQVLLERIERNYPILATPIFAYINSDKRLLPVYLLGNKGTLQDELIRGLNRTLIQLGLNQFRPRTQYLAAINTIIRWEKLYPDMYNRLSVSLIEKNKSIEELKDDLELESLDALKQFEFEYLQLTAGARFDEQLGVKLADLFNETVKGLREFGYNGVLIVWDEFGRFMEEKSSQVFGAEAAQLQDFAEYCNRSGDNQVHLVLITHRQLATYSADLPEDYQKEWSRIAERFWSHNIISDPTITYRLIVEAIKTLDEQRWHIFTQTYRSAFEKLAQQTEGYCLFNHSDEISIVEKLWPIHPLTAYALPRLTRRVAQNERTLFTFLANDDENTVQKKLETLFEWSLIGIDALWDYFEDGIRADKEVGGTHRTWLGVMSALDKLRPDDILSSRVIKALGILQIVGDVNVQTNTMSGRIVPSTELLAWSIDENIDVVQQSLQELARRRVVAHNQADNYWVFLRGSSIDLESEIKKLKSAQSVTKIQLQRLFQTELPPPTYLPLGYNLDKSMTRFFTTIYRWHNELDIVGSDEYLKRLHPAYGYADGVVVFVLALNQADLQNAINTIQQLPQSRAIFVVPKKPLLLIEPAEELFALRELQNNPQFMQQDERLYNELKFFVEDAKHRLERVLAPFFRPNLDQTNWYAFLNTSWKIQRIRTTSQISRLLSDSCYQWFSQTPAFNNELLNLHSPSTIQISASQRMIDALLRRMPDDCFELDLGIDKNKPERLIVRTLLVQTGLLEQLSDKENQWKLVPPKSAELIQVWQKIEGYLLLAMEDEQEITLLIEALQLPPFGLRAGILPIILATAMRPQINVLTIRHHRRIISPITGELFIQLCNKPDEFTIEVGVWDVRRAKLWTVIENYVLDFLATTDHEQQPLSYLSLGLLRWLQGQPRYNRDTNMLSPNAQKFRALIRKAHQDPTTVLFHDLLELLENPSISPEDDQYQSHLAQYLSSLVSEINGAYRVLLYNLDRYAEEVFANSANKKHRDGRSAMHYWITQLEQETNQPIGSIRFSDALVQSFLDVLNANIPVGQFWEQMGRALIGIPPSDWNDASVQSFEQKLLQVQKQLRQELLGLGEDDEVIDLVINRPKTGETSYRFRSSDLSQQGKNILANFKTTMAISGRPLSPDEKRQVALAFLHFMLEGESGNERKNKSLRVHR